jgi:hypothetical protein
MNPLLRVSALLLIGPCLAAAQQTDCSAITLGLAKSSTSVTAPAWRIYLQNKSAKSLMVRFSALDFHWKIEEHSYLGWQEALTGGVGPGKSSIESSPERGEDRRTIGKHQRSLVTDFDVRRDAPTDETTQPGKRYRITFAQEITLLSDGREAVCKLVAQPQSFTVSPLHRR